MRADALNSHVYPVRTKMTVPSLHVCFTDKSELKEFLFNKTLLQSCFTEEEKSKGINFNDCSTEEDKSECAIKKQTDAKKEVTYDVLRYFNVFECGRKLLNRLDIDTPRDEYYTNLLETLVNYNDRNIDPLSNEKIQQAVRRVMAETEE